MPENNNAGKVIALLIALLLSIALIVVASLRLSASARAVPKKEEHGVSRQPERQILVNWQWIWIVVLIVAVFWMIMNFGEIVGVANKNGMTRMLRGGRSAYSQNMN